MASPPAGKKSWTFMVYMAGDNNLDPEGVQDLQEMKKVGSTAEVNVIAQFDRCRGTYSQAVLFTERRQSG